MDLGWGSKEKRNGQAVRSLACKLPSTKLRQPQVALVVGPLLRVLVLLDGLQQGRGGLLQVVQDVRHDLVELLQLRLQQAVQHP